MKGAVGLSLLLSVLTTQCRFDDAPQEPLVEVGVFFGGQVQRVKKVEVPAVRPPKIGFRVDFPEGVPEELRKQVIEFEVVRPGPAGRRVTERGSVTLPPGQERIDHVLKLSPTDKLGVWNVRVVQNQTVLADRALYLVAESTPTP